MLHVDIIAIGSIRELFYQQACQEYLKRNSKYYRIRVIEVKEESLPSEPSPKQIRDGVDKETQRLQEQIKANSFLVGLSPKGSKLDSLAFATLLDQMPLKGFSHCTFAIGGSFGLSDDFLQHCHQHLSFSELTFPHQLFRVILLEQLFRSAKINHGEIYHK